jgi:peptidoglycan/xylan/chitin deacetylase (PgdA/CDA1 family)
VMDVGTPAARERAHEFLHRRLMHEPSTAAIDELLLAVARAIDRQPEVPREALPMTDDELRMLATGGTVSIGCHTLSHLMLSQLDAEQQRTELEESQAALQRSLGRTVPWFAYPYGHPSSYNDATLATARELFDLAATTRAGPAERADPHQLPRYLVGDWKAEELAARLDQWLGPAADPKR